jgi:uncharacterized membrane protein
LVGLRLTLEDVAQDRRDSPERLTFFSDAVVAIALTLLAIELPVPSGVSRQAFVSSLHHNQGHYVAFLVSFAVVAVAWRNHKAMTVLVAKSDPAFETLNFVWLLTVVLLPFAAKLLTVHRGSTLFVHACTFGFYAFIEMLSSVMVIVMLRHARLKGNIEPGSRQELGQLQRSCISYVAGFGFSIPLFFVTNYAWALWIIGPIVTPMAIKWSGWSDKRA